MPTRVVTVSGLNDLIGLLRDDGYRVIGPTVIDDAIVYDEVSGCADLPVGMTDEQEGGHYRLKGLDSEALFQYNVGPSSWKQFLFPPELELLRVRRSNGSLEFVSSKQETPRLAFFSVRACELAAIAVQDRVFAQPGHADPTYSAQRREVFVVGVNCGKAGNTCFCVSMDTGPECKTGYDIVITELCDGPTIEYVVESGSDHGAEVVEQIAGRNRTSDDETRVDSVIASTVASMTRQMPTEGLQELLIDNPDHPRWAEVADRCLTCGNCTLACPTCFCSTTEDRVTLDGEAIRSRVWDSCFSLQFTGLHGNPVRSSVESRYRQWMTHKLATWQDQFGSSGCVGCGRCITWCPVGIDITAEVAAMRERTPAWTSNT